MVGEVAIHSLHPMVSFRTFRPFPQYDVVVERHSSNAGCHRRNPCRDPSLQIFDRLLKSKNLQTPTKNCFSMCTKRQEMDAVSALRIIASDLNVELDELLCSVKHQQNQTLQIVVTLKTIPKSEDERSIFQSAFMCQIVDSFPDAVVQVHVPPPDWFVEPPLSFPSQSLDVESWIQDQATATNDMIQKLIVMTAVSCCRKVIHSYPWADKDQMEAKIPVLVREIKTSGFATNAVVNVDRILIPLQTDISDTDFLLLMQDVILHKRRCSRTLLELYEAVYEMVVQNRQRNPVTDAVFQTVFRVKK